MLEEGTVLRVYHDVAGVPTVCTGHMMLPQDWATVEHGVTPEMCDNFLRGDIKSAEAVVNQSVTVPISQNQFDALVSFQFNTGALPKSSVLRYLNEGNVLLAAQAFMLWIKRRDPKTGGLVVDAGLASRRAREQALFLLPDALKDAEVDELLGRAMAMQFDLYEPPGRTDA